MMKFVTNLALSALLLLLLPTAVLGQTPCTTDADCLAEQGFCGRDALCHAHSGCQEWFTFGQVQFTGSQDNATAVTLDCTDYTTGFADNANGITFGCRPYAFGNKAPEGTGWGVCFSFLVFFWPPSSNTCVSHTVLSLSTLPSSPPIQLNTAKNLVFPLNQKCTTPSVPSFTCFQIKDNTDYTDFLGELARFSIKSCDREEFENEQPLYWYIKEASDGGSASYGNGRENTFSSDSFNPSEADKTFYSTLGAVGGSSGGGDSGGGGASGGVNVQHSIFSSSLIIVGVAVYLGMNRY